MVAFLLLKFGLSELKAYREYRNVSERTLSAYMEELNKFHEYCLKNEIINVEDCTASLVKEYLLAANEKDYGLRPVSLEDSEFPRSPF